MDVRHIIAITISRWRNCFKILIVIGLFFGTIPPAFADQGGTGDGESWGVAVGYRIARIPYPSAEQQVADVVPLLFFENKFVYIRGLEGGVKLFDKDRWRLSLIGRYRFFDIPAEYQNDIRGDGLDLGIQTKYRINQDLETNVELMSDDKGRLFTNLTGRYNWESGSWKLMPFATLRYKGSRFNERYFGLDGFDNPSDPGTIFRNKIGGGWDITAGSEVRYHVISNLYLIGRAQITSLLDGSTRDSASIDDQTFGEVYLGIAFFEDQTRQKEPVLEATPYWRFAFGWATPSNMGDILLEWDVENDPQNNKLTSVFYGHPVADSLFGVKAFDVYVTPGLVYHLPASSYTDPDSGITYDNQPTTEFVLAMKFYYTVNWPFQWRLGFAEGLSYAREITNLEQREMDQKEYRASNLLNFIDITVDFNLGDLFRVKALRPLWLGYSLHHRSAIFETSSAFGRIKGGSNYNTFYLQYHF